VGGPEHPYRVKVPLGPTRSQLVTPVYTFTYGALKILTPHTQATDRWVHNTTNLVTAGVTTANRW